MCGNIKFCSWVTLNSPHENISDIFDNSFICKEDISPGGFPGGFREIFTIEYPSTLCLITFCDSH